MQKLSRLSLSADVACFQKLPGKEKKSSSQTRAIKENRVERASGSSIEVIKLTLMQIIWLSEIGMGDSLVLFLMIYSFEEWFFWFAF